MYFMYLKKTGMDVVYKSLVFYTSKNVIKISLKIKEFGEKFLDTFFTPLQNEN